jgi:formate hydrogenlyase subunit 6/NADH:ubiquinone oxidoreductase subunit I
MGRATEYLATWTEQRLRPSACLALIHYQINLAKCVGCTVCAPQLPGQ